MPRKKTKNGRGGPRRDAGRKPGPPKFFLGVRVDIVIRPWLGSIVEKGELTASEVIEKLCKAQMARERWQPPKEGSS